MSMDWQNNEKLAPYVLVQSKPMECEVDESVDNRRLTESTEFSLHQCLKLFTEPEKLAPEEAWYCPTCKEHREATKEMSVWRLPSTLIIQLKRFSFKNMLWRDKIDKMVDYPVRGLDLSPYCSGPVDEVLPLYDLYGVVNHMGGILGGHYTAYVRLPSHEHWDANEVDWRLCDDSRVSTVSEKNTVSRSAYLLFYRRRQPPATAALSRSLMGLKEAQILGGKEKEFAINSDSDDTEIELDAPLRIDEDALSNVTPAMSGLGYTDMDDVD